MKIIKKRIFFSLIVILSLLILSFSGCVDPIDTPELPRRGFYMGILPTTAENQTFEQSYKKASMYAEFVPIWASGTEAEGFWDYAEKLSGWWGNTFLKQYIRGNNMFPIIHFTFIDKNSTGHPILKTPPHMPEATLQDSQWQALYKESVIDVVNTVHPKYISIGNEVNKWFETYGLSKDNPNGFQHFINLYEEIYDEVKKVSPQTQIFCVFCREIVKENREANMSIISQFDENKMDLLALTTYPYAVQGINKLSDIPIDYYQRIASYMPNTPFGFTEIGWSSLNVFGGEKGQYDFLINLSSTLTQNQGINLELFGYIWLHDQPGGDTTGLIKLNGKEKLAYNAWKQISNSNWLWSQQDNEKIVFISKADSEEGELYLINKNNTITRLTHNNRYENNPALSFDGKKVAFHAGDSENPLTWEIFILDLETLQETQLTDNNVLDGHPDWSPDNSQIVFASFRDEQGNPSAVADLFIVSINGTMLSQLTNNEWEDNDPEWSPDGSTIVFKSNRRTQTDAREEIYIINSDGSNVKRLTTTTGWESDHDPSWSPDSRSIAYMHYAGIRPWTDVGNLNTFITKWDELTPWNTYIVDLNGTSHQVTNSESIAQLAVFSHDGDHILYLDNEFLLDNNKLRGINHYFTLVRTNGTMKRQLLSENKHTPTVEYFDW